MAIRISTMLFFNMTPQHKLESLYSLLELQDEDWQFVELSGPGKSYYINSKIRYIQYTKSKVLKNLEKDIAYLYAHNKLPKYKLLFYNRIYKNIQK